MSARRSKRAVEAWCEDVWASELPPTSKLVAQALSRFMDFESLGSAFPGPARLANLTGLADRTVKRHLRELVEAGWLEQTAKGGSDRGGARRASAYRGRRPAKAQVRPVTEDHGSRVGQKGQTRDRESREPVTKNPSTRDTGSHHPGHNQGQEQRRPGAGSAEAPPAAGRASGVALAEEDVEGAEGDSSAQAWLLDLVSRLGLSVSDGGREMTPFLEDADLVAAAESVASAGWRYDRVAFVVAFDALVDGEEPLPPEGRASELARRLGLHGSDWDEDFADTVRTLEQEVGWSLRRAAEVAEAEDVAKLVEELEALGWSDATGLQQIEGATIWLVEVLNLCRKVRRWLIGLGAEPEGFTFRC